MSADRVLIERAVAGDEPAVRVLVRRLTPIIWARAQRKLSGRGADVEDLAQDVWLSLISNGAKALLSYDPERGVSLEGYVGMLAERKISNLLRNSGARKRGARLTVVAGENIEQLAAEAPELDKAAAARDQIEELGAHLSRELPERGQLVFRYVFRDGVAPAQAAMALGVSVQVVYNWQHKIRATARAFLRR